MNEPLVSVLSVTYNHAPYIAQAIESFLAQKTTFPFEIVIGEDCSTDGTREIVFGYANRYPKLIRVVASEKNVGGMNNFQRTFAACRGKYVAICEGDDYWHHREKLQIQTDWLEAHPECGTVHSNFDQLFDRTGKVITDYWSLQALWLNQEINQPSELPVYLRILEGTYRILTCTLCARRELMCKVYEDDTEGFDGRFMVGDTQLFVGLAFHSGIKYIDKSLATYRILKNSASRSADPTRLFKFQKSVEEVEIHLINKYGASQEFKDKKASNLNYRQLVRAYWEKDWLAADQALHELTSIPIAVSLPLAANFYRAAVRLRNLDPVFRPLFWYTRLLMYSTWERITTNHIRVYLSLQRLRAIWKRL